MADPAHSCRECTDDWLRLLAERDGYATLLEQVWNLANDHDRPDDDVLDEIHITVGMGLGQLTDDAEVGKPRTPLPSEAAALKGERDQTP